MRRLIVSTLSAITISLASVPMLMAQPAVDDVIVEWQFDRLSPDRTRVLDARDRGRDLQLHGEPSLVTGESRKALRLDGKTWAQGPTMASLGVGRVAGVNTLLDGQAGGAQNLPSYGLVLEAHVRPATLAGEQTIIACYEAQGDQRSFCLWLSDDRAMFAYSDDGTVRGGLDEGMRSELRLQPGRWNQVVLRYDGQFVQFEINGQVDPARAYCPGWFAADRPIQVGRRYDGKKADAPFRGDIALIRLTRTAAQTADIPVPVTPQPSGTRNNLVRDLVDIAHPSAGTHAFEMPEDGWVYVALRGVEGPASVSLDGTELRLDATNRHEAMKRLTAGEHALGLHLSEGDAPTSLIVRKVPEMMYIRFGYGAYDWAFLSRHVLRYANVCVSVRPPIHVTAGSTRWFVPSDRAAMMGARIEDDEDIIAAWTDTGREWIVETHSGYWDGQEGWRDALARWREGFKGRFSGTLADEFGYYYSRRAYALWADYIAALHEQAPDRRFYAYCFGVERFPSNHDFLNAVLGHNGRVVWERYIREAPDEDAARAALRENLIEPMAIASQLRPGFARQVILCPSVWTGIGQLTDDFHFDVDQKVMLDMQFQVLATDPAYRGLAGIGPWTSGYASPEMIRWLGALFRHYGVEGRTELLSQRYGFTYRVDYLDGAGFENPDSLSLEPAASGTLTVRPVATLPQPITVNKSYAQPLGDWCVQMDYMDTAPNRVRQKMTNLTPGRLYSVQFYALDLDHPVQRPDQPIRLGILVEGGQLQPGLEEQLVIASGRGRNELVHITRSQHVFRAMGTEAELVLSDWASDTPDASARGRRVICDNLSVQPYFSQAMFDQEPEDVE